MQKFKIGEEVIYEGETCTVIGFKEDGYIVRRGQILRYKLKSCYGIEYCGECNITSIETNEKDTKRWNTVMKKFEADGYFLGGDF